MARRRRKPLKSDFQPLTYGIRPAPRIPTHITVAAGIDSRRWADSGMWVPVMSSNVSTIRYRNSADELYVSFSGSRTYRYSNVPRSVAELCFNASSLGTFVHRVLIPNYPAAEVSGLEANPI